MAKIKPKTLTCPNCASPVPVRNVMKAKTVVCGSCSSQIDMSTPNLEILAQLRKQHNSHHGIIPGMKGTLPDGTGCECIGRVRFEESDTEDTWHWDEWLILSDKGQYHWLEEDEGKFSLLTRFDPDVAPTKSDLTSGQWIEIDNERVRIHERGNPKLVALQGELTWKATIGDRSHYADGRGAGQAFSIEWNDEEIEFFKKVRVSRTEALTIAGLQALLDLEKEKKQIAKDAGQPARNLGFSGVIAGGGAGVAATAFVCSGITTAKVTDKTYGTFTPLPDGAELFTTDLNAGQSYSANFSASKVPATVKKLTVAVETPIAGTFPIFQIEQPLTVTGRLIGENQSFVADSSGTHRFIVKGEGGDLSGVSTSLYASGFDATALFCLTPVLIVAAIALFMLSAARKAASIAWVGSEMRKRRSALITEIHDKATVQE